MYGGELILARVPLAKKFVWIVTADIKDMHVQAGRSFVPFLEVLADLVANGVAVRLIHAKEPGPRFRAEFDRFDPLISNDLFERVLCPRVHTKAVIIDGQTAFVGSPNLTGAGMGSKHDDKRNFEAGFLFDDAQQVTELVAWVDRLYDRFNNGVYRAGFATTQKAYETAVHDVAGSLDFLEQRLDGQDYLVGDRLTEADIRAFVTLIRFDLAYHGLFKINLRQVREYPNLRAYMQRIHGLPGIAETVDADHIKAGYYSIRALNPAGIVPLGPALTLSG